MTLLCLLMSTFVMPVAGVVNVKTVGANRLSTPMVGIDVSSWNEEIDWAKVKAAGVEFAIVRIFHHLKNTPNYELDEQFERNVREAQKYGIQLGAYFFSYAKNIDAITTEANMVVNELNKYPGVFTFPIVFDAEDGDTTDDPNVSGNDIYDIGSFAGAACKNFCTILEANGYYPMVYSYDWYFEAKIGMSNVKDFDLWQASYPKSNGTQIYAGKGPKQTVDHSKRTKLSSYDDNVTMWQYTGAGVIDGIYAGDGGAIVDLNVCYVDYPSIIKGGGYNGFKKTTGSTTPAFQTTPLTYRTGANGPASTYKNSKYYTHVTSIGLTGDGVTDTLAAALSQLGYYEGTASNPYGGLYNTWDGGYTTNKTTEYVYNYGDADNSGYKMAWCASFCSWALYQTGVTNHSTHDQSCRENIGNSAYIWRECSCYQWADQLKRFNLYSARGTYTPKAGDLIFFKMEGGGTSWTNHIGLVLYCDGSRVYTVEGNRHNHVGLYDYSLSDSQICGYGKLPYPTNANAPKVDYTGKNKTAGQYITNNVTLSVSSTKGGATSFTIGKYEMFEVTGFDGSYARVSYKGSTGYATLNSNTIQVTAAAPDVSQSMNVSVDTASIKNSSYAAGAGIPAGQNAQNPNIYITGLREDSNSYTGLENFGSNKDKIMINGRTWTKWESRWGEQVLKDIWVYGVGDGKAYLGIDITDLSRLHLKGTNSEYGEEIKTIVIKRGFEVIKTASNLMSSGEISSNSYGSSDVVGVFKENVILVANSTGGFDVYLGGSNSLGLDGYTFQNTNPRYMKVNQDGVNIRSGPDTTYDIIAKANSGETYEFLEGGPGSFRKIDYKGQVAWISNNASTLTEDFGDVNVVADANVRSGPDTTYSILGVATAGTKLEYLGETQNSKWMKVDYNGQTGWISNANATLTEPDYVVSVTAANEDWVSIPDPDSFSFDADSVLAAPTVEEGSRRFYYNSFYRDQYYDIAEYVSADWAMTDANGADVFSDPDSGISRCTDGCEGGFAIDLSPNVKEGVYTITATDPSSPSRQASKTVTVTKEPRFVASVNMTCAEVEYDDQSRYWPVLSSKTEDLCVTVTASGQDQYGQSIAVDADNGFFWGLTDGFYNVDGVHFQTQINGVTIAPSQEDPFRATVTIPKNTEAEVWIYAGIWQGENFVCYPYLLKISSDRVEIGCTLKDHTGSQLTADRLTHAQGIRFTVIRNTAEAQLCNFTAAVYNAENKLISVGTAQETLNQAKTEITILLNSEIPTANSVKIFVTDENYRPLCEEIHYCGDADCGEEASHPHNWDEGVVATEATYATVGERLYTCTDCGATKEEPVAKKSFVIINRFGTDAEAKEALDSGFYEKKDGTSGTWYEFAAVVNGKQTTVKVDSASVDGTVDGPMDKRVPLYIPKLYSVYTTGGEAYYTFTKTVKQMASYQSDESKCGFRYEGENAQGILELTAGITNGASAVTYKLADDVIVARALDQDTLDLWTLDELAARGKDSDDHLWVYEMNGDDLIDFVIIQMKGTEPCAEHSWDGGTVTTNPTYGAEGVRTHTCSVCGATKTEPVAKAKSFVLFRHDSVANMKTELAGSENVCTYNEKTWYKLYAVINGVGERVWVDEASLESSDKNLTLYSNFDVVEDGGTRYYSLSGLVADSRSAGTGKNGGYSYAAGNLTVTTNSASATIASKTYPLDAAAILVHAASKDQLDVWTVADLALDANKAHTNDGFWVYDGDGDGDLDLVCFKHF